MIKIIKQEINHELKNKVEWSYKLNSTKPIFINGSLLKLKPTNIGYIEKLLTIRYIFYSMVYYRDLNTKKLLIII